MEIRKKGLPIEEAREIDIVIDLSKLGYEQAEVILFEYWYFSLLRNEKTPSFKVNRKINLWYDFGIGKGGSIVDFGTLYFNCSIYDFLCRHDNDISFHRPTIIRQQNEPEKNSEIKLKILNENPLFSYALFKYLQQRKIPFEVAPILRSGVTIINMPEALAEMRRACACLAKAKN